MTKRFAIVWLGMLAACSPSPDPVDGSRPQSDSSAPIDGASTMDASDGSSAMGDATAADAASVGCAADVAANGWELCEESATTCSFVFADGTGCAAACARIGLACAESYENVSGACMADGSLPALGCADTSHGSDYCTCGTPVMDGSVPIPSDGGTPGDGGMPADGPIGWASVAALGLGGTTGGAGGAEVTATNAAELIAHASAAAPLIIRFSGTMVVPTLRVASNKTLLGVGPSARIQGGVLIEGSSVDAPVSNVIVRNITVDGNNVEGVTPPAGALDDAMAIRYAHHVWIDHCFITNSRDGLLDITLASDYVTVSWSRFAVSATTTGTGRRAMLIGADDGAFEDRGRLHVTVHHNWWSDYLRERMPRVRFGPVHVFNNYYVGRMEETAYGVGAGFEASVLVENNYFDNFRHPHQFMDGTTTADLVATGNQYVGVSDFTLREARGTAFTPPYPYTADAVSDVPALVQAGAGPH